MWNALTTYDHEMSSDVWVSPVHSRGLVSPKGFCDGEAWGGIAIPYGTQMIEHDEPHPLYLGEERSPAYWICAYVSPDRNTLLEE